MEIVFGDSDSLSGSFCALFGVTGDHDDIFCAKFSNFIDDGFSFGADIVFESDLANDFLIDG